MHSFQEVALILAALICLGHTLPFAPIEDPILMSNYFEGDMQLTLAQLSHLTDISGNNVLLRNGKASPDSYWPDRTLIYSIANDVSNSDWAIIKQAMDLISERSCVRFRRTLNPFEPQVVFQRKEMGCWSYVGYLNRRQELNLGSGCLGLRTVQHELLHSLGFYHMQNDHTRDSYVRIQYENIATGRENNFKKYTTNQINNFGVDYDYDSIMHYSSHAFSKNGRPTIVALRTGVFIGRNARLSEKDYEKLNRAYCL